MLVLLDKDMPVCGFTFLDTLSKYKLSTDPVERAMAGVRVVGCTGHAIGPTIRGFKTRGAVEVLTKPAERADLRRVLSEARAAAGIPSEGPAPMPA
jgi:CheY-like chemotaxis protein